MKGVHILPFLHHCLMVLQTSYRVGLVGTAKESAAPFPVTPQRDARNVSMV